MAKFFFPFLLWASVVFCHGIIYEAPSRRFGDQLIAYMHAKWLSYRYQLPLLYKPFIFSHELLLEQQEKLYDERDRRSRITLESPEEIAHYGQEDDLLFYVRYFPESPYEISHANWWTFPIDWEDPGFISLLRASIRPKRPFSYSPLPEGRIAVAVHVRRGGGGHDPLVIQDHWPLKFVPDSFYISQIRALSELFPKKPLYVHLFTDDPDPEAIAHKYQKALEGLDILFYYTARGDTCESHVLEDLFNMMRYACLIRPDSNYSIVAEKLGDYTVVISPADWKREGKEVIILPNIKESRSGILPGNP